VLEDFGFAGLGLEASDFARPNRIVQLGRPPNRIDLVTSLSGVSFERVWATRVAAALDGIPVPFISLEALLRNKKAAGRPKDLSDVHELRRRSPQARASRRKSRAGKKPRKPNR
jgi:hypothetical protein